jgi:hypothetical protein
MAMSITNGGQLMRDSFAVVRRNRALLWFPVISSVCLALTACFWIYEGAWLYVVHGPALLFVPLVLIGLYSVTFVGVFFSVALAATAAEVLGGGEPSLRDGVNVSWSQIGGIAGWAAQSILVALVLGLVENVNRWVGRAAQVAWGFATIFVVPLIALEGLDAGSARQRSFGLAREQWRAETGGLGLLQVALFVPALFFALAAKLLSAGDVHSMTSKALLGVVLLCGFGVAVTAGVVRQVFAVELYRQAAAAETA